MTDKSIDYVRKDIERLFGRQAEIKDELNRFKTYFRESDDKLLRIDNRVKNLIIQENKNNQDIRAAQEDINQLYLLFNELLRSIKKGKDDG